MDIQLENLRPFALEHPRIFFQIVELLCQLCLVDPDTTTRDSLEMSANALLALYHHNLHPLHHQLRSYFYTRVLPVLQQIIRHSSIGDHIKWKLCTVVEELEGRWALALCLMDLIEFEAFQLKKLQHNEGVVMVIKEVTQSKTKQVELIHKFGLLESPTHKESYMEFIDTLKAVLSADVLSHLADFLYVCQTHVSPDSRGGFNVTILEQAAQANCGMYSFNAKFVGGCQE